MAACRSWCWSRLWMTILLRRRGEQNEQHGEEGGSKMSKVLIGADSARNTRRLILKFGLILFLLFLGAAPVDASRTALASTYGQTGPGGQATSRFFPETGKMVQGVFLDYWDSHGGLPQQGYPISDEMQERSDTDGKPYMVQYVERAVFEKHPENQPPYDVLLSLLGNFLYKQKYPGGAPGQQPNNTTGAVLFNLT